MKDLLSESPFEIYQSIIENNLDVIFILSTEGLIVNVNQAITKLLGYPKEEIQGMNYQKIIVPEYLEMNNKHFLKSLQGVSSEYAMQAFHKNKEIINLQVKSSPLIINNEIVGVYCVAKAPTVLNHTKVYLNQMGETLQALFNSSKDAINILDIDGNVLDVNPAFEEIYGWEREEVIGKPLPSIPLSLLEKYCTVIEQAKLGKHLIGSDATLMKKNGEPIEVSITFFPNRDTSGKVIGTSLITREINKQRRLEQSLKKSEGRYKLIAENMSDLVCIINLDGSFKYASPSHVTVLGVSSEAYEAYEGIYAREWMHPDDYLRVRKQLEETAKTKETCIFEFRFRNKKGNWVWLEGKSTPVFNETGDFEYFLVVSRDITERRMYEKKLNHMAYHDTLTGLPNSRLFKERLKRALNEAKQYERKMAIMYMDLDCFKYINDTYGHDVGDELLKQFAQRVKECLRDRDTLARQGGDEFTIILPDIQKQQEAIYITDCIINRLQRPWRINQHSFQTSSSIGISFYPNDGSTGHELMKHADTALYLAKEDGKNKFKTHSLVTL